MIKSIVILALFIFGCMQTRRAKRFKLELEVKNRTIHAQNCIIMGNQVRLTDRHELRHAMRSICSTAGAGIYNNDFGAMKHNSIYIRNRAAQALGRDDLAVDNV